MAINLLESNRISQNAFSGMATNYLCSEYQNGYINNVLQNFKIINVGSNSISIAPGVVLIEGSRILNDDNYDITITSFPDSTLLYHLVLKLEVTTSGDNAFSIIYRQVSALQKDDILKEGTGIYELELATFDLSPNGISNFKQELLPIILQNEELEYLKEQLDDLEIAVAHVEQQIITANEDASKALEIVNTINATTTTGEAGSQASVNITTDTQGHKTFDFIIPTGAQGPAGPQGNSGTGFDFSYNYAIRFANPGFSLGGVKSITSDSIASDKLEKLKNSNYALIRIDVVNKYIILKKNKDEQIYSIIDSSIHINSNGSITYYTFNVKWSINSDDRLVITATPIYSTYGSFTQYWTIDTSSEEKPVGKLEYGFGTAEFNIDEFYIIN